MGLECFRSVLALALATTWHTVSVSGDNYTVRCNGMAQFTFDGMDTATPLCGGNPPVVFGDDGTNAVVVSLGNSVATVTVREGTTTTNLQFNAINDTEVTIDIQSTDFSKASSLQFLSFDNLDFVDQVVTLTIPDSLTILRIGESNADDVGLHVSGNSKLSELILNDTYDRIPRILYERNYTQKLNSSKIKDFTTFDWTGTQNLTEEQIITLKNNVGDLSAIGLTWVDVCSSSSSSADTHLVCASDSQTTTPGSSASTILTVVIIVAVIVSLGLLYVIIRRRQSQKWNGTENTQMLITSIEAQSMSLEVDRVRAAK